MRKLLVAVSLLALPGTCVAEDDPSKAALILAGADLVRARGSPAPDEKPQKRPFSPSERLDALRRAAVFTAKAVSESDIAAGPDQKARKLQLGFNYHVVCAFDSPGQERSGNTQKFDCRIKSVTGADGRIQVAEAGNEEVVKVKFGPTNNETHAEVAGTRLLWALGFYADAMFPVRLECEDCPADPWRGQGERRSRTYSEAVIERKLPGRKVFEGDREDQGWSWTEFEKVNTQPVYQKDGLKALAAFLVHGDNKPPQQRLVCEGAACEQFRMLIQDLGATFGGGGWFTTATAKMNLQAWSAKKVWKRGGMPRGGNVAPAQECQAELTKSCSARDGLKHPRISEEGRRFAAGLLCQLSDSQIQSLFEVARVAEMPDKHNADGSFKAGLDEGKVVQQWVQVFKRKREELAAGRCRWTSTPADLAPIDNPMGLATVPNHCSARPF